MPKKDQPQGHVEDWHVYDAQRAKPRINIVLAPEERDALDAAAEVTGESRSVLVGRLILKEAKKLGVLKG